MRDLECCYQDFGLIDRRPLVGPESDWPFGVAGLLCDIELEHETDFVESDSTIEVEWIARIGPEVNQLENNVFEHSVAEIVDCELVAVAVALAVGQIVSIPKKSIDSIAD